MNDQERIRVDGEIGGYLPSPIRRAIARQTVLSVSTVPHFHLHAELDAAALVAFRKEWNETHEDHLTVTDLLLAAQGRALADFPAANAIWLSDRIVPLEQVGVGIVVSIEDGMLTPVLRNIEQLGLSEISRARHELVLAARSDGLRNNAFAGAASSLSNMGATRVDYFHTVISPPQSSMLSAGRIALRPWIVDGEVVARPTLKLGLAVDHRVLDGVPAAAFLECIVSYLEHPDRLIAA